MSLPKMELRFEKRRNGKDMSLEARYVLQQRPPEVRYVLQQRFDDGPWHDVPVVDQDAEREERNMKQQDVIKSAELIAGLLNEVIHIVEGQLMALSGYRGPNMVTPAPRGQECPKRVIEIFKNLGYTIIRMGKPHGHS